MGKIVVTFIGKIIPRTREDTAMNANSAADSSKANFNIKVSEINAGCLPAPRIFCVWFLVGMWGLVTCLKLYSILFCFVLLLV
jgi:hypothetical protein